MFSYLFLQYIAYAFNEVLLNNLGNKTECWPRLLSGLFSDTFQLHTLVCSVW